MAKTKKPTHQPSLPFPPAADELHQEGDWLWIPLREEWRDVTNKPEERRTQHGHKSPRADIVVWQSADDKAVNRSPALVVECKTGTWVNSDAGRDHFFKSGKTTIGLGTINSTVICTAPIPLPSVHTPRDLINVLTAAHSSTAAKRTEAEIFRQSAWAAFESALFTTGEAAT